MSERTTGIYCRISKDREGAGLGVTRQREDCAALAARQGWTVADIYVDNDISAFSGKRRPAYERLLEDLAKGTINAVIAWHPDRLHRHPKELERFIDVLDASRAGFATVQAGEVDLATATGRMTARVVGAVARHESEMKSERLRRKARQTADEGKPSGGGQRPFGFEPGGITLNPVEAGEIRSAARRVLAGETVRGIAREWRDRDLPTVTGRPWQANTVRQILGSHRISGQRALAGKVTPAVWPAIVTPEDTARLRIILHDPARLKNTGSPVARVYLLNGFLWCGACGCGARMTTRPVIRKGHRYPRYACTKDRGGCNRVGISAARLEEAIEETALDRLDSPAYAALAAGHDEADDVAALDAVTELEARVEQFARDYADGLVTRPEFFAGRGRLQERLDEARRLVARRRPVNVLDGLPTGDGALRSSWPGLSLDRRRAILATVLERIVVAPTTKANNRFDPGRLAVTWLV